MSASVPRRRRRASAANEPRLNGSQLSAINRFPDENPNPVLRIDQGGRLMYANPASTPVVEGLDLRVGAPVPGALLDRLLAVGPTRGSIDVETGRGTFALWPVRVDELGFTNVYGRDVTAERAIVKFPDENPHPVLRIHSDGMLLYANPASAALMSGLGVAIDEPLAADLRDALVARAHAGGGTVEVETGGRTYSLLPVDVPSFGFINVYGTDVTAVKERERLARENERLLLNILPAPIARRLRDGEPLIADRFDDVTLMFADVVEFTRLSSRMSPTELVTVLNDTFCAFDDLVERHGLEKVKTIGDAYMVVGGMPERSDDHTLRVASMALDLAEAVDQIDSASRLGIRFRIGLHCGPVVAGVIGTRRFIYDIWGDTVNLASRMESLGVPGRVQVTGTVVERLRGSFRFEPRGVIDVKGKGPMPTWFLVDHATADAGGGDLGPQPLA